MEKVLFLYLDYDELNPSLIGGTASHGLAALAGALRASDIQYALVHFTSPPSYETVRSKLSEYTDHRIIALSFTSIQSSANYRLAAWVKAFDPEKYIIAGGVHPTVDVEDVTSVEHIDCACIGEGETVLPMIVHNLEARDFKQIPNIVYRDGATVRRNPFKAADADLDTYPWPDYSIFDLQRLHCYKARTRYLPAMLSRGCPYHCTYCSNYALNKVTGLNRVRVHGPERAIALLRRNLTLAEFLSVGFDDDVLGFNRAWARTFFPLYKEEIGLPFKCYVRPEYADEELVELMKTAGCYRVTFGVETGVESLRFTTLRKRITDDEFVRCFRLFREYGIGVNTNSMIGIPGETMTDSLETIKFNARNGVDISLRGVFTPYPFTELYEYCKERGLFRAPGKAPIGREFEGSVLKLPGYSDTEVKFVLASWNLLTIMYRKLYQIGNVFLINTCDRIVLLLKPLYPVLIALRQRFFLGKLSTYLYKRLEKRIDWIASQSS